MTLQLPFWVWPTALAAVCLLALVRGRTTERAMVAAVVVNWIVSYNLYHRSEGAQYGILAADTALFLVFLWPALKSGRHWPLFNAGFGLLLLVTHLGKLVDPTITGWAYITAELIWSYMILIAIGYGAWTAPRRYAEIDDDPDGWNDAPGATLR